MPSVLPVPAQMLRASACDQRSRMDPENVSGGSNRKKSANLIRARFCQVRGLSLLMRSGIISTHSPLIKNLKRAEL
jgi:hypothetical protein